MLDLGPKFNFCLRVPGELLAELVHFLLPLFANVTDLNISSCDIFSKSLVKGTFGWS
jgi:hypothetical protein